MPEQSAIVAITAGTNPVTGIDSYVIEYSDGETQSHEGSWSETRTSPTVPVSTTGRTEPTGPAGRAAH